MIQNIKVDIVYYMTAADFEFEFNLGSCCHMRLLNDKAKDKKAYVNSLARAVSRSQIIISCGPLFGEDGLIAVCAAAINHGLQRADNKAYGIASDDSIDIIAGSIPLVTPEGYFGGCIIESGNQSIILLTENRTIRKSIMKTLIHPYIEDISIMQSSEKTVSSPLIIEKQETDSTPAIEKIDEPIIGMDEFEDEPENIENIQPEIEEPQVEDTLHNISFDFSDEESTEDVEVTSEQETEPQEKATENEETSSDSIFLEEEAAAPQKPAKTGKGINISILIVILFLAFAVLALCYFIVFIPLKNGISTLDYFKQIFNAAAQTIYI
ncbi:MAG: hypothetical protein IKN39_04055 [Clostridia bacterium]|nr:hypothetical protein [Clostridia bacterium]